MLYLLFLPFLQTLFPCVDTTAATEPAVHGWYCIPVFSFRWAELRGRGKPGRKRRARSGEGPRGNWGRGKIPFQKGWSQNLSWLLRPERGPQFGLFCVHLIAFHTTTSPHLQKHQDRAEQKRNQDPTSTFNTLSACLRDFLRWAREV